MHMLEKKLTKWAASTPVMMSALIALFVCLLILMVLSVQQTGDTNDAGDQQILGAYMSGWGYAVCQNDLVQLLSPFLFDFKVHHFNEDIGQLGCPWRERNSIMRLSFVCIQILVTLWQFIIIMTRKNKKFWGMLHVVQWALFISMCTMFVLDCDGLYVGYSSCDNNFDVTGFGPVILAILGAEFTTTLPPYFYGPYRPNWQYQQYDDTTVVAWDLAIVDGCYVQPYIYTNITELALIFCTYIVYRLARLYKFERKNEEDDDLDDEDKGTHPCNCFVVPRFGKGGRRGNKRRKKASMAEADGNRPSNQVAPASETSAYNLGKYHVDEPPFDPQAMEPHDWKPRKQTYEQNFSEL